ncbi:DNA sulfur modification protein DndD [Saccharothrix tamanrassetensis]|uniref:Nuclease SbcCD subunit C n=1 Tax=Saccharothrix tamanrassetensis TaxID=1051531 RepID=A0A841CM17_9PSEU|nr:DNA sulfur modification protein DndD [Saccharothrix tamanrassetensis]MBB5957414.1 DNA sulfur modification protein DndD [Saccharothrix tamanrassetensis]
MLLHKVSLEEFGAYRGKQSLDLLTRKNRPIILIGGLNGCGKTTLLDAIQLALYGPRARCSGRGNRPYETYLRESINRQADPTRGASVALEFAMPIEGEEHYYRVIRSWRTSGKSVKEYLSVWIDENYGERLAAGNRLSVDPKLNYSKALSEGWSDHVEDLLPLEVASLFFFDGEKIESLADPERAASVIESAVHSLLGVNTVEQLRTDLLVLQRRQRLSGEDQQTLAKIRERELELEVAIEAVTDAEHRVASCRTQLDRVKKERKAVEDAFAKEGGTLFNRREELQAERDRVAEELAAVRAALTHLASGALPFAMLHDQLETAGAQAAREREAEQARQVLGVLEERDQWVVDMIGGSTPSEAHASLFEKLDSDRARWSSAAQLDVTLGLPQDFSVQLAALRQALSSDMSRARELLQTSREAADKLAQLERQLAGVPAEAKIEALQQALEQHRAAVAVAEAAYAQAVLNSKDLKRRRDSIANELERSHQERVRTLIKAEEAQRIVSYSDRARDTLERFGNALLKRHINRLEVAVLQSFKELMRKHDLVHDLQIDVDKFTLTLSNEEGEPIDPGRLSAGERQLLAVSLLWGLVKVAGNRLPSVIDTPLGRLDSRHRQHLVDRYFPHASHQVLLLSTDEEIDEQLLSRLQKSIAHSYTLVHDDTTLTTTVQPGYWWATGGSHVA